MLSDVELIAEFGRRKRRQWGLMWVVVSGVPRLGRPRLQRQSPWVATGAQRPFFVGFAVVAVRFTSKNLVCPACEAPVLPHTHRYYVSGFACPRCARRLS